MIVAVCASVSFYKQLLDVEAKLQNLGLEVILPQTVKIMAQKNDFSVSKQKTWFQTGDYSHKTKLITDHFGEIEKADAVLVVNLDKNGLSGYIGGNVLMEMTVAFYLKKPIYILNKIDDKLPIKEEIYAMNPLFLQGDLESIKNFSH